MHGRARCFLMLLASVALGLLSPTIVRADVDISGFLGLWQATITPDSDTLHEGRSVFKDQWLFEEDGQVTCEAFGPMGFPRAPFTVTRDGGADVFTFTMSNSQQGTVVWTGARTGDSITGTLIWTRADGEVSNYTISARRVDDSTPTNPG